MEQYRDVQLYEWDDAVHAYETNISDAKIETYLNKYFLIDMLMPVLDRAMLIGKYTRARRDGLLATLHAMEARRSTGQWPTDIYGADVIDTWSATLPPSSSLFQIEPGMTVLSIPDNGWPVGRYRVEFRFDGVTDRVWPFTIN